MVESNNTSTSTNNTTVGYPVFTSTQSIDIFMSHFNNLENVFFFFFLRNVHGKQPLFNVGDLNVDMNKLDKKMTKIVKNLYTDLIS